jgi:cysteine-rich repeat protein
MRKNPAFLCGLLLLIFFTLHGEAVELTEVRYDLEPCGDGVTNRGEECDDGNMTEGDGCESDCTLTRAVCGDNRVSSGEACDDGNLADGDGCDSNCTLTGCGNGVVTEGETCDDGNATNGDGCSSSCGLEPGWRYDRASGKITYDPTAFDIKIKNEKGELKAVKLRFKLPPPPKSIADLFKPPVKAPLPAKAETPKITFDPPKGGAGSKVTITGSGFTKDSVVNFFNSEEEDKLAKRVTFVSETVLKAVVPWTAATGKITVTTPPGPAVVSEDVFTVLPTIQNIVGQDVDDNNGIDRVVIFGSNFTKDAAVSINDKKVDAGKLTIFTSAIAIDWANEPGSGTATPAGKYTVTTKDGQAVMDNRVPAAGGPAASGITPPPLAAKWTVDISTANNWFIIGGRSMGVSVTVTVDPQKADLKDKTFNVNLFDDQTKLTHDKAEFLGSGEPTQTFRLSPTAPDKDAINLRAEITDQAGLVLKSESKNVSIISSAKMKALLQDMRDLKVTSIEVGDPAAATFAEPTFPVTVGVVNSGPLEKSVEVRLRGWDATTSLKQTLTDVAPNHEATKVNVTFKVPLPEKSQKDVILTASVRNLDDVDKDTSNNSLDSKSMTLPAKPVRDLAIWGVGPGKRDLEKGTQELTVWVENHGSVKDIVAPPVLTRTGGETIPLVKGQGAVDIAPGAPMKAFQYEMRLSTFAGYVGLRAAVESSLDVNPADNVTEVGDNFPARYLKDLAIDPEIKVGAHDRDEGAVPVEVFVTNLGDIKVTGKVTVGISTGGPVVKEELRAPRSKNDRAKVTFRFPEVYVEGLKPVISLVDFPDDVPANNSRPSPAALPPGKPFDLALTDKVLSGVAPKTKEQIDALTRYDDLQNKANASMAGLPDKAKNLIQATAALGGCNSSGSMTDADTQKNLGISKSQFDRAMSAACEAAKATKPADIPTNYKCQISVVDQYGRPPASAVKVKLTPVYQENRREEIPYHGKRRRDEQRSGDAVTVTVDSGMASFNFSYREYESWGGIMQNTGSLSRSLSRLTFELVDIEDADSKNNRRTIENPSKEAWSPTPTDTAKPASGGAPAPGTVSKAAAGVWTVTELEPQNLEFTRGATVSEAVANMAKNAFYGAQVSVKSPPKKGAAGLARVRLYEDDVLCASCESKVDQDAWRKNFSQLKRPMLDKFVRLKVEVEEAATGAVLALSEDTVEVPGLFTPEQYRVVARAGALSVKDISVNTAALTRASKTAAVTVLVENNGASGRAEANVEVGFTATAGGAELTPAQNETVASIGSKATHALTFEVPVSTEAKNVTLTASLKNLPMDDGDNSKTLQTTLRGHRTDLAVHAVESGNAAAEGGKTFPVKVTVKNLGFPKETGVKATLSWGTAPGQSLTLPVPDLPVDGQASVTFQVPITTSAQTNTLVASVKDAAGADAEPSNDSMEKKAVAFPVIPYRDLVLAGLIDKNGNPTDSVENDLNDMMDKVNGILFIGVAVKNDGNLPNPDDASLSVTVGTTTPATVWTDRLFWDAEKRLGVMAYKWPLAKTRQTLTLKASVKGGETAGAPAGNNTFEKQVTFPNRPWDLAISRKKNEYLPFDEKKQRLPIRIVVENNGPGEEKDVPPPFLVVDNVAVPAVNDAPQTIEAKGEAAFDYDVALSSSPKRMSFALALQGSAEGDSNPRDNTFAWTSKALFRPVRDLGIYGIGPGKQDVEKGTQGLKVWVQNHGNDTDTAVPPVLTMNGGEKIPMVKGPSAADIAPNGPIAEYQYEMRLATYPRTVGFRATLERAHDVNPANDVNEGASDFPARHIQDLTIDPQIKVGALDKEEQTIPVEAVVRNRGEIKVTGSVSVSISTAAGGAALVTETVRAPRTKDATAKVVFRVPQVFREGIKPVVSLVNYKDDVPENNSVVSPTPLPVLDLRLTGFKGGGKTSQEREAENRYNIASQRAVDACKPLPETIRLGIAFSGIFPWQDAFAAYGADRYTFENCMRELETVRKTPGRPEKNTQTYSCQISVVDQDGRPAADGVKVTMGYVTHGVMMSQSGPDCHSRGYYGSDDPSRGEGRREGGTAEVKNGVADFSFSFSTEESYGSVGFGMGCRTTTRYTLRRLIFTILEGQDGNAGNNVHTENPAPMADWSPGAKTSDAAQAKPSGPRPVSAAAAGTWAVTELEANNLQMNKSLKGWDALKNGIFGARVAVKSPPKKGAAGIARALLTVDGEPCASSLISKCEAKVDQDGVWKTDFNIPRPELDKTVNLKVQVEEIATGAVLATSEETVQVPGLYTPEEYRKHKRAQALSIKAISANSARVTPESTSNVVTVVVENNGKSGQAETDVEVGLTATVEGRAVTPLVATQKIASIGPKAAASVDFELPLLAKKTTADVTAALKNLFTDDGDNSKTEPKVPLSAFRLLTIKKVADGIETDDVLPVTVSVKNEGTSRENNIKVTLSTGTKEIAPSKVIETVDPGKTVKVTLDVPLPAQDQLNASLKAALPDYKDVFGSAVVKTATADIPARIVHELAVKSIALGEYASGDTVPVTVVVENRGTEKESGVQVTLTGYSGAERLTQTSGAFAKRKGGTNSESALTFQVPVGTAERTATLRASFRFNGAEVSKEADAALPAKAVASPVAAAKKAVEELGRQAEMILKLDIDASAAGSGYKKALEEQFKEEICSSSRLTSEACGEITVTLQDGTGG